MDAQPEGAPHKDDAEPFDAAAAQALIEEAGGLRDHLQPDPRLLYGAWGLAWLLGYGTLALTQNANGLPPAGAFVVFGALLLAAGVLTAVHITRRSAGLRGASTRAGVMYGITWPISFVVVSVMVGALGNAGVDGEAMAIAANGAFTILVGVLYMAGGAMYRDMTWFLLGVWIAVVAAVAGLAGLPALYWIMALAGGGGLLIRASIAVITQARTRGRA